MKESEILARFAEVTGDTATVEANNAQEATRVDKVNDPDMASLFGFFGTTEEEKVDTKYIEKLSKITEFAKEGANDRADLLWNIKGLKNEIGEPTFGQNEIDHLYNYILLKEQQKSLNKEIEAYRK